MYTYIHTYIQLIFILGALEKMLQKERWRVFGTNFKVIKYLKHTRYAMLRNIHTIHTYIHRHKYIIYMPGLEDPTGEALGVEGQVDYLINDARNPSNLCRIFPGWAPWL